MRTIEEKYLRRAKDIHDNFLSVSKDLDKEQKRLVGVKEKLQSIVKDLQNSNKKLTETRNKNDIMPVYKILEDLDIQYKKMEKIIKPLIDKVESLRKEENVLYDFLVRTYQDLNTEEIKRQVKEHVFKK